MILAVAQQKQFFCANETVAAAADIKETSS
jgi:hypothetical protein